MTKEQQGFSSCGQYYRMEIYDENYIDYLKGILKEIRYNSKNKNK